MHLHWESIFYTGFNFGSQASKGVHKKEIKALRIQLTAVRWDNLAIKIELDNINNQA